MCETFDQHCSVALFDSDDGVHTSTMDQYLAHVGAGFFLNCFRVFFIEFLIFFRKFLPKNLIFLFLFSFSKFRLPHVLDIAAL